MSREESRSSSSDGKRPGLLILVLLITTSPLLAQLDFLTCNDSTFCIPSVSGLPRSKGLEIKRESFAPHQIETDDDRYSESLTSVERLRHNERWKFRMRAPVVMKKNLSMAVGLRYSIEEFNFRRPEQISDAFLREIEDRALRSAGITLYSAKPFRGNRFLITRFQADVNGDFRIGDPGLRDYLKLSAAALYGFKVDTDKTFALGLSYSYVFGRATVIPILAYYKTSFNEKWGLELVLPASARLRYVPSPKNVFYAGANLSGAGYLIQLKDEPSPLFLETSELRIEGVFEREIHDWLWASASIGYRHNMSFDLARVDDPLRKPSDIVLRSDVSGALLYSLSVFIVPPRKFLN